MTDYLLAKMGIFKPTDYTADQLNQLNPTQSTSQCINLNTNYQIRNLFG